MKHFDLLLLLIVVLSIGNIIVKVTAMEKNPPVPVKKEDKPEVPVLKEGDVFIGHTATGMLTEGTILKEGVVLPTPPNLITQDYQYPTSVMFGGRMEMTVWLSIDDGEPVTIEPMVGTEYSNNGAKLVLKVKKLGAKK